MKNLFLPLILLSWLLSSCLSTSPSPQPELNSPSDSKIPRSADRLKNKDQSQSVTQAGPRAPISLRVVTYNVENLFDAQHDEGKNDYAFLPQTLKSKNPEFKKHCAAIGVKKWRNECMHNNWTEEKSQTKIKRIAKAIDTLQEAEPIDALALQEVENKSILADLNQTLKNPFPHVILIEGPDERGIDVALLSRFKPLETPELLDLKINKKKPARGALKVRLGWPGDPNPTFNSLKSPTSSELVLYVVHLPSQGSPAKKRKRALDALKNEVQSLKPNQTFLILGDFNITQREEKSGLLQSDLWLISHEIDCKGCLGTYFYWAKRKWSFFDVMLFDRKRTRWTVLPDSIRIQTFGAQTPTPFEKGGASDHFPVEATLVPVPPK